MHRREFLKTSLGGIALLSIGQAGCDGGGNGGDGTSATTVTVGEDYLTYDASGNAYEILRSRHVVRRLSPDGNVVWQIGGLGTGDGELNYPETVTVDGEGFVYVADRGNSRIEVFDSDGGFVRRIGGRDPGDPVDANRSGLDFARQIAIDGERGRLYVCDTHDHQIEVFDLDGRRIGAFGEQGTGVAELNHPVALALDDDGDLHVVDGGNFRIQVYAPNGDHLRSYGRYGHGTGELVQARSIVIDGEGRSWVADAGGFHLDVFERNGEAREPVAVRFADGRFGSPLYVSLAPDDTIYVTAVPLPASASNDTRGA